MGCVIEVGVAQPLMTEFLCSAVVDSAASNAARPLAFAWLGHSLARTTENGKLSRRKDFGVLAFGIGIHACKASALPLSYAPGVPSLAGAVGIPARVPAPGGSLVRR